MLKPNTETNLRKETKQNSLSLFREQFFEQWVIFIYGWDQHVINISYQSRINYTFK